MKTVTVPVIRTDADLDLALVRLREIWYVEDDSPEADEFEVLGALIQVYEREHYPMAPSEPIEALRFHMDRLGLKQADLVPCLGASSRVSEILARKRSLTVEMIRKLHQGLGIPVESLIGT